MAQVPSTPEPVAHPPHGFHTCPPSAQDMVGDHKPRPSPCGELPVCGLWHGEVATPGLGPLQVLDLLSKVGLGAGAVRGTFCPDITCWSWGKPRQWPEVHSVCTGVCAPGSSALCCAPKSKPPYLRESLTGSGKWCLILPGTCGSGEGRRGREASICLSDVPVPAGPQRRSFKMAEIRALSGNRDPGRSPSPLLPYPAWFRLPRIFCLG